MAYAKSTVTIDRPVNVVFDFLSDGANNLKWRPSVTDIQKVSDNPTIYKQGLKGPTGRIDGDYQINESKPNERIVFQVIAGPARPTGTYTFEAVGQSTKLTFALHFEPKGLGKLIEPMINSSMKSEVGMLANLKEYLEKQA